MPKVSEAYRAARRDEIIDAALRRVQRDGFRNTSMAGVIEESGLSAGAIYGHFASKQELFVAVAERVLDAREADLEAARSHGAPLAPGELMRTLIGGLRREPVAPIIPQIWAEAAVDPELRAVASRIFARLRDLLGVELTAWAAAEPGRVAGDPARWAERVAPVVIAAAPGFLIQRLIVDDFDEDDYLIALGEVYLH